MSPGLSWAGDPAKVGRRRLPGGRGVRLLKTYRFEIDDTACSCIGGVAALLRGAASPLTVAPDEG